MERDPRIAKLLHFWFEETEPKQWFIKEATFDEMLRERFGNEVEQALAGNLADWSATPDGNLARILLLDQLPRNLFRHSARSFAGDSQALECCLQGWARGDQEHLSDPQVKFLLMPMMHSEDLAIQDQSLPLFKAHCDERTHEYAVRHRDIIARFGRFPHRNALLGRSSTEEEAAFLLEPNSSF